MPSNSSRSEKCARAVGGFVLAALAIVLLGPSEAEACSFAPMLRPVSPAADAGNVPINVQILLRSTASGFPSQQDGGIFALDQVLEDGGTLPVAFSVESHGIRGIQSHTTPVLIPTEPLEPYSTYRVSAGFNLSESFSFHTGAEADITAPAPPPAPLQQVVPFTPYPSAAGCYRDSCWHYEMGGTTLYFAPGTDAVAFDVLSLDGGVIVSRLENGRTALFSCSEDTYIGGFPDFWMLPPEGEVLLRAIDSAGNISGTINVAVMQTCERGDYYPACDAGTGTGESPGDAGQTDEEPPPANGCSSVPLTLAGGLVLLTLLLRRRGPNAG